MPIRFYLAPFLPLSLDSLTALTVADADVSLTAADITFGVSEPTEGETVPVTIALHNGSSVGSGPLTVAAYATASGGSEWYAGSAFVPDVPAGGEAEATTQWNTTGFTGTVPVRIVADPYDRLAETNEDNNQAATSLTVKMRADLRAGAIAFEPVDGREGQPVTIEATISNAGQTDAPAQSVSFHDGNPSTGGALLCTESAPVGAGDAAVVECDWTATGKGPHTLYVVADSGGQVNESQEDNNTASAPLYVGLYDQVYLDSGSALDPPYDPAAGYGYLSGQPLSWGTTPIETARWNSDGTAGVQYQFDYLLPSARYHLDFTLYDGDKVGRVEDIWVDGFDTGVTVSLAEARPYYASLLLDPVFYNDHVVLAAVKTGDMAGAVVSEVAVREIQYVEVDCGPDATLDPAYSPEGGYGYLNGYGSQSWGTTALQTVRTVAGAEVQYRFDGLQPARDYQVNLTLYEEGSTGRQQVILVDGTQVGGPYTLTSTAQEVVAQVPLEAYVGDGSIVVGVRRINGNYPVVSEIALEQRTVPYYDPADDDWQGPALDVPVFSSSVSSDAPLTVTVSIGDAGTGGHGVSQATLLHGYASPYTQEQVAGTGPGGNGDGLWTFVIPSQGDGHEEQTLKFSLLARDGDDSPTSTTDTNAGSYYAATIADEDTTPPAFSDPSPASVQAGQSVTFTLTLHDPSGIVDTAAGDASVFLQWDTDGEFTVNANVLGMHLLSGDTYQADQAVGPFSAGTVVSWQVYAEDDDNSRAGGWSEVYTVTVEGDQYHIYLPIVMRESQ